jgi:Spy/CpxP family protein refolding chaperone
MKVTHRLGMLVLLTLLATALPVLGQEGDRDLSPRPPHGPHAHGGHGGPPNPVMGMAGPALRALDLSDDQVEAIHGIMRGAMEGELEPLLQAVGEARHALELTIWNPAASEQDLTDASQALMEQAQQLDVVRHRLALQVLELLTEEQREALQERLAEAPSRPGPPGGHGRRGGHGHGRH